MDAPKCRACESNNVVASYQDQLFELPLCESFTVNIVTYLCLECSAEGDFTKENDVNFEKAKQSALTRSVNKMLDDLAEKEISASTLERSLSLAPGETSRWRKGFFSDSNIALLRLIKTYPWLLGLAAQGYDSRSADVALVVQSSNLAVRLRSKEE